MMENTWHFQQKNALQIFKMSSLRIQPLLAPRRSSLAARSKEDGWLQNFLIGSINNLSDSDFKCCSHLQEPAVMFSEEYQVSCLDLHSSLQVFCSLLY